MSGDGASPVGITITAEKFRAVDSSLSLSFFKHLLKISDLNLKPLASFGQSLCLPFCSLSGGDLGLDASQVAFRCSHDLSSEFSLDTTSLEIISEDFKTLDLLEESRLLSAGSGSLTFQRVNLGP